VRGILGAAVRRGEGHGREVPDESFEANKTGEESGLGAVGGLGNVLGTDAEPGERNGAGYSHLAAMEGCARMTGVCPAGSDR